MKNNNSPQINEKLDRIFLIGMPASGKSTLGKTIAEEMQFDFIDLDTYIEEKNNLSISEIFENYGESIFRNLEKEALEDMLKFHRVMIATGGGTPCFFNNMEFIKKNGKSIFLEVSLETIAKRILEEENGHRPLYQEKQKTVLLQDLEQLYKKRLPFYQQADIIAKSSN